MMNKGRAKDSRKITAMDFSYCSLSPRVSVNITFDSVASNSSTHAIPRSMNQNSIKVRLTTAILNLPQQISAINPLKG